MKYVNETILIIYISITAYAHTSKSAFCKNLICDNTNTSVCGLREEGAGVRFRLFDNECELMTHGCSVEDNKAYGIIKFEYCENVLTESSHNEERILNAPSESREFYACSELSDCSLQLDAKEVCGVRHHDQGFVIKLFQNKCYLHKHNCNNNIHFAPADIQYCYALNTKKNSARDLKNMNEKINKTQTFFVIDSSVLNFDKNVNNTIDNFFAATHVLDLPVKEIRGDTNDATRRMLIDIAGPATVFKPWINIPKKIKDDYYHRPTLSSCYHKCPTACPDTYAPVCGVPGIAAREPSLMFKNHCYMDFAQCKMYWENKSSTALTSWYIESSFIFCLGDQMNGLYRFLPLVRTLQHMGRLKLKGQFKYKFRNLRFFNEFLAGEPKFMG